MSYSPPSSYTIPPMVSVFTSGLGLVSEDVSSAYPSSNAALVANKVHYSPIVLPAPCVVRRVWWANGATTTGGATIEVGVYADSGYGPGTKLVSGSATQGTASQVQFVDVTDTALAPGLHWIAIGASSTTNTTWFRVAPYSWMDAGLGFEETSAIPMPATATPAEASGHVLVLCGFATTASP